MPKLGKTAHVDEAEISKIDMFIAQNGMQDNTQQTVEELSTVLGNSYESGVFEGGKITHSKPGTVYMFPPGSNFRTPVPETNLRMLRIGGWQFFCPDCHTDCYDNPNDCPGRDKVKFTMCPVCDRPFYDNGPQGAHNDREKSPEEVVFFKNNDTPDSRLKRMLTEHLQHIHPSEAAGMGIK